MSVLVTVLVGLVGGFFALVAISQVLVRSRARAMRGRPLPALPGSWGRKLARSAKGLVYFHSPGCAACRSLTPKMEQLSRGSPFVHLVDVSRELDLARALNVMATPSTIEVAEGRIVEVHVGPIPGEVLARFGRAERLA